MAHIIWGLYNIFNVTRDEIKIRSKGQTKSLRTATVMLFRD